MAWQSDSLHISISGDGQGDSVRSNQEKAPGVGLTGMRERLTVVGGTLQVERPDGRGFVVLAMLPYETGGST